MIRKRSNKLLDAAPPRLVWAVDAGPCHTLQSQHRTRAVARREARKLRDGGVAGVYVYRAYLDAHGPMDDDVMPATRPEGEGK